MAQALTATMVKKQTAEMMNLLNRLQGDACEIIAMEIVSVNYIHGQTTYISLR